MVIKRKWKIFEFEVQHGDLNMTKPDVYEGNEGHGNNPITRSDMDSVIADWIDARNRDWNHLPLYEDEIEAVKHLTEEEQRRIFGRILVNKYGKVLVKNRLEKIA